MATDICLLIASVCVLVLTLLQIKTEKRIDEIERKINRLIRYKDYKGEYPKLDITSKMLGEYYSIASMSAKEDEKRMEEVREITSIKDIEINILIYRMLFNVSKSIKSI